MTPSTDRQPPQDPFCASESLNRDMATLAKRDIAGNVRNKYKGEAEASPLPELAQIAIRLL